MRAIIVSPQSAAMRRFDGDHDFTWINLNDPFFAATFGKITSLLTAFPTSKHIPTYGRRHAPDALNSRS
jgi:hypothetical protein